MSPHDRPGSLVQKVITLIKEDERSLRQLSEDSDLPLGWIKQVYYGPIRNPSANRVQYLYEFMSNKKLEV